MTKNKHFIYFVNYINENYNGRLDMSDFSLSSSDERQEIKENYYKIPLKLRKKLKNKLSINVKLMLEKNNKNIISIYNGLYKIMYELGFHNIGQGSNSFYFINKEKQKIRVSDHKPLAYASFKNDVFIQGYIFSKKYIINKICNI